MRVSAATAEIPAHQFADLFGRRLAQFIQQAGSRHELSGSAVSALERVVFDEGLLKLAEPVVLRETLDRGHGLVIVHHRERHARFDAPSVQKDRAGAALAPIATLLRSGQPELVA
jgi:hypothetical protein